jgi:hypothetical protein
MKKSNPSFKNPAKIFALLALLMFMKSNVFAQDYVSTYASPVTSGSLNVEKTIEGNAFDLNYYVLSWGTDPSPFNNENIITCVTKITKGGGVIWCKKYGFPSTVSGSGTEFKGFAITMDNGPASTGNIAIGGYLEDNSADYDFVMEIDTDGIRAGMAALMGVKALKI